MTTNPAFKLPGPGLTRQAYLDLLAAGHETGWYDQNGDPAPWPEDFLDPEKAGRSHEEVMTPPTQETPRSKPPTEGSAVTPPPRT